MSDGELAVVDELITPNSGQLPLDAPVVVILHGLSGSSDSNYIRWLLHSSADGTLCSRAVRFLVLHARGAALERADDGSAGGTHRLQRPLFYNAAFTRDLHEFGAATRLQHPRAPLFLVGFSMGGNIATKMLSEAGAKSPFLAACVVCNPFDLNKITDRMLVYPGLIYSQLLVRGLKRFLERNHDILKHASFDMVAGMKSRTVHEFDKSVVVPLHGFSDVRSYYTEASSSRRVDEIAIPFLSLSAADDPLCDSDAVPRDRCAANSIYAETPFGGHVAHIESLSSVSYIDKVVLAFVDAVLEWRESAPLVATSA
jgi:predicted alpha/beta-fold hydrolase